MFLCYIVAPKSCIEVNMITLRMIEAFRAVFINGSISEAATFMRISQPAVSRLIKNLEAEIGFQLFDRRRGRVYANDDALVFFEEVDRSYIGLDRLERAAQQIHKRETGGIKIACMPAVGFGIMPQVIAQFQQRYPNLEIDIQVVQSTTVMQLLTSLQCDIGFVEESFDAPSVESGPVYHLESVCILPPGHHLSKLSQIKATDLAGESFISLGINSKTRFKIDAVFEAAGVHRLTKIEAPLMKMVCSLVLEGCGLSIVDPMTAATFVSQGLVIRRFQPSILFSFRTLSSSRISGTSLIDDFYATFSHNLPETQH